MDDIDPEYGLHDYNLHLDMHGGSCTYLCGTFKSLFCRKGRVDRTVMSDFKNDPCCYVFPLISDISVLRGETEMDF